jgi:hypothetical protein
MKVSRAVQFYLQWTALFSLTLSDISAVIYHKPVKCLKQGTYRSVSA